MHTTVSVRKLLAGEPAAASAPCRVDSGGTWDIKAMALPFEGLDPTTVNAALSLRTTVLLTPHDDGWIRISSEGFPSEEEQRIDDLRFTPPFGLFLAAVSLFGFHGLDIRIRSQAPVRSALGGSSTALVALIRALAGISDRMGRKKISRRDILHLAYHLEDGVSGGNCGLQDQAAAVYGGVHQWKWRYGRPGTPYERIRLLDATGQREFSERLLVAFSGTGHSSSPVNRGWIEDFLSGRTRSGWIRANECVHRFAGALREKDWRAAARCLREEMAIRREITPGSLIPITAALIARAEEAGCGARFAGAGAGGCVWALGEPEDVARLKPLWDVSLRETEGGGVLDCRVDASGVRHERLRHGA